MDDEFEQPRESIPAPSRPEENADGGSSDEEEMPDWTKLPMPSGVNKPIIPKRGEKDFEPTPGASVQEYNLGRARQAMVNALRGVRGINSKTITYGIWFPHLARTQIYQARGVHFMSIGHSVKRLEPGPTPSDPPRSVTRTELLPEEALYLIERGSLMCYKSLTTRGHEMSLFDPEEGTSTGQPITVQQAFAEMIGREDLTLEKYELYAYLKRLGFVVTRAEAPLTTPSYPLPPPPDLSLPRKNRSFGQTVSSILAAIAHPFSLLRRKSSGWLTPLWQQPWWPSACDYPAIFKALRVIPAGHYQPLRTSSPPVSESPYKVFYNIWKPNTPWKKSAPPPPDFCMIVINARTTPLPSLDELTAVFATLPYVPPPLPKRRNPLPTAPAAPDAPLPSSSLFHSLLTFSWLRGLLSLLTKGAQKEAPLTPHPFAAIRAGHKNVVIGVVDAGTTTFFRFGEGCFEEWPVI